MQCGTSCTCRVYVAGNQYDKARALARTDPALKQYVEQQHTQHLLRDKNADGLASIGNATEAIEIYAQQGDWVKVHQLAEQAGPPTVIKYSIRYKTITGILPVTMGHRMKEHHALYSNVFHGHIFMTLSCCPLPLWPQVSSHCRGTQQMVQAYVKHQFVQTADLPTATFSHSALPPLSPLPFSSSPLPPPPACHPHISPLPPTLPSSLLPSAQPPTPPAFPSLTYSRPVHGVS